MDLINNITKFKTQLQIVFGSNWLAIFIAVILS